MLCSWCKYYVARSYKDGGLVGSVAGQLVYRTGATTHHGFTSQRTAARE